MIASISSSTAKRCSQCSCVSGSRRQSAGSVTTAVTKFSASTAESSSAIACASARVSCRRSASWHTSGTKAPTTRSSWASSFARNASGSVGSQPMAPSSVARRPSSCISRSTRSTSSWSPHPGTSQMPHEIGAPAIRSVRAGRLPGRSSTFPPAAPRRMLLERSNSYAGMNSPVKCGVTPSAVDTRDDAAGDDSDRVGAERQLGRLAQRLAGEDVEAPVVLRALDAPAEEQAVGEWRPGVRAQPVDEARTSRRSGGTGRTGPRRCRCRGAVPGRADRPGRGRRGTRAARSRPARRRSARWTRAPARRWPGARATGAPTPGPCAGAAAR